MIKVNLNKYNNVNYKAGSKIKLIIWYFINQTIIKNKFLPFSALKKFFLQIFGAKIGREVVLKPGISVKYPWKLEVGDFSWIGEDVWIDNLDFVHIQDNVCISQGAMLLCGNHNYKKKYFDLIIKPIKIKSGAWVGAKSIVCPGVTLNSHSVLSVSSVATNDLEAYAIYSGNPAQKIRIRKII